ncbi:MAG: LAGLIDADG family homing endonuclease [Halobacteriales archaeon]|nr:LAGLIDADG family homing endonuclease [Halobacteriales archaeon]
MADVPESIRVSDTGFSMPTSEIMTGRGFITGKSGSGKSVLEGTIVYTEDGRKPIEDVERGEKVLSLNKHDYQQEFREVQATIEHEAEDLLRITLEDGTQLVGTTDHSFLTVDDLEIVPIPGEEVEEGTWFPLARELPGAETVSRIDLAEYVTESHDIDINEATIRSGQKTDERYLDLDFEAGKVVGLYLAEGSLGGHYTVQISNIDEGVRGFLGEQGFRVYDRTCNRAFQPFGRFVEGEFGRGSGGKALPNWVFDAPKRFKAGLLSGYIDGDGSVADTVTTMSKSPELTAGIKELLRHFGIASTVRDTFAVYDDEERKYQRLSADAFCLERLRDAVDLSVAEKAEALDQAVESIRAGDQYNSKDLIPGFGPVLNDAARERGWTTRQSEQRARGASAHLATRRQKAGRATFNRFVDDLRIEGRARKFGRSDIQWQRVVEVEELDGTHTVYDLDVQLNDNFIADGVFVHNSNTASVVAEELLEHGLPMLIVDTDGEYYGLKGRYELLHVGADADCDAVVGVEHAEKLAELALVQNVPVILDVSGYVEEDVRIELVRRVIERLFELGKQVRKPFLVFVEEIHEFLPQNGKVEGLSDTLITVAKRGRKRGIGVCGMSQRPAAVDKDFITQCDWVVWHRLTWDNDKRVAGQMLGGELAADIDDLDTGEALLMTDWDDRINRIRFRRKRTFDAGATPDLDDIDTGSFSPVRTGLINELSGEGADLNDIDLEELGARQVPGDPEPAEPADLEEAAEAATGADGDEAERTGEPLEASPAPEGGEETDIVTVASKSTRRSYAPPEPTEDDAFDPVFELGHLIVYVFDRLTSGLVGLVNWLAGVAVGTERRARRDLQRLSRFTRRRVVRPAVRELEEVAAYGLSDRLIAGVVLALAVLAVVFFLLG